MEHNNLPYHLEILGSLHDWKLPKLTGKRRIFIIKTSHFNEELCHSKGSEKMIQSKL
jgi:hypothetical protein